VAAIPQLIARLSAAMAKSPQLAIRVEPSRLGDDAGMIGAAQLARRMKSLG
jgi:hypothetical protein